MPSDDVGGYCGCSPSQQVGFSFSLAAPYDFDFALVSGNANTAEERLVEAWGSFGKMLVPLCIVTLYGWLLVGL